MDFWNTVLAQIRQEMKVRYERSEDWARQCFSAVNHVSHVLIECQIPHVVVVGNIKVDGQPYYRTTSESLAQDIEVGYEEGSAAHAHTWVRLKDGTLIDAAIIPTLAKKMGRRIKWNEAIYTGREAGNWGGRRLTYIPMLFGLSYYRSVVIPTKGSTVAERFTERYGAEWQALLDALNQSQDG